MLFKSFQEKGKNSIPFLKFFKNSFQHFLQPLTLDTFSGTPVNFGKPLANSKGLPRELGTPAWLRKVTPGFTWGVVRLKFPRGF